MRHAESRFDTENLPDLRFGREIGTVCFFVLFFLGTLAAQISSIEDVQKRLRDDPENKDLLTQLALQYTAEKQNIKAVSTYFELLKIDPNNFHAYNNLGILYKKAGQFKDSVYCYEKALKINPDYYLVHYNMGLVYEAMGRMQEAREAYGRALSLNPEFAQALQRLKELSDDPGKAASLPQLPAEQILVADPSGAQAKPLISGEPSRPKGTPAASPAPKETPEAAGPEGGEKPEKPKNPPKAGKGSGEMVRTLRSGPGAPFFNKAMNALEKDDLKAAIENYCSCILQDREFLSEPDNGLIRQGIDLLRDRPNSMSEGLFYRGYLLFISGSMDEAIKDLKLYVEQNQKGPYREQAESIIRRHEARMAAIREKEAAKVVEVRLASSPEIITNATYTPRPDDAELKKMSAEEIIEEGKRFAREGRLRDAIATIKAGLDKDKSNIQLMMAMANVYTDMMLLQGDNEAGKMARDIFEKIMVQAPPDSREAGIAKNMAKELNTRIR